MSVLILAEHDNQQLAPSTLAVISAGLELADTVTVLAAGYQHQAVVEQLSQIEGVANVWVAHNAAYQKPLAEDLARLFSAVDGTHAYLLAAATTFGKNVMPRVAALLDVAQISDIVKIDGPDTFVRPIYAGSILARVQAFDATKVITVRPTSFALAKQGSAKAEVKELAVTVSNSQSVVTEQRFDQTDRPDLATAKIVVSGGRGMQSAENFKLLEKLADRMHAAVGASRAAVDAGFVPNDLQVGQTGKVVAPDVYFAIGISGAVQHVAGIKDAKVIVAINKDPDAPIFEVADYGLVADFFEILPEWEAKLDEMGFK